MILSDGDIRKRLDDNTLVIEPLDDDTQVQPASIDVRLDNCFRVLVPRGPVDACAPHASEYKHVCSPSFDLEPGMFALGCTVERICLPDDLVARVEGKSTLGRLGLLVHSTAGFVDPGFAGQITLELGNITGRGIRLRAGMKIAQLSFELTSRPVDRPYGHPELRSHYQHQSGATLPATA